MTPPIPDPSSKPPRIEFLRRLLPHTFSEEGIAAEEARLLRYFAIIERIARRLAREEADKAKAARDSTQPEEEARI